MSALFLASSVFAQNVALRLLLLGAAIVLAAVVVSRKEARALPPIWVPFVLWAAWAALSVLWSIEPERTLKEWRNEVFYTGAALWVCYVGAQAQNAIRVYAAVLATAAGTACLVALYEFPRGWDAYAAGWHGGPGDHSSALLVLMPCVAMAGWFAARQSWPRWTIGCIAALALLLFAAAYTTLNRTIWLGFAVEFLVLGGLLLGRTKLTPRAVAAAGTLALAAVAGCGAVIMSIQTDRQALGVARGFDQDSRIALWPQVAERIAERPIAGYGFGRGMLREALQAEFKAFDAHLWHAHNLFLEALLQSGVVGLALLVLLLAALVRAAWRHARHADDAVAGCGIALLAVVAGMLVRNMTDFLLVRQNALLFWGVVGVLLALGSRSWRAPS